MSSTPGIKPIPASKPAPIALPQAKPIEILHDDYSFLASNVHAAILLSGLVLSFNRLVQDPINTLVKLAPLVIIIQLAYCFLCLPSTGQAPPPPKQKWKKQSKPTQDFGARAVVCLEGTRVAYEQRLTLSIACLPLTHPDHHPHGPLRLPSRHLLWRTTHDAPGAHHPAFPTPWPPYNPTTILRTRS
jgi:hypothetical protein